MASSPPSPPGGSIGQLVRGLRIQRGLTQEELASAAGLSVWQLSRIERGKAEPSRKTIAKLTAALGVAIERLDADRTPRGTNLDRVTAGELLRLLRSERGLTQEVVAAKAEMSVGQLSRIEGGKAEPSRETLTKLASALGVSIAYLDAQALSEAVALRATAPAARSLLERVLSLHDRIATMSERDLQRLFKLLDRYAGHDK